MAFTWDRKESLEQYAARMLGYGDLLPFDAPDAWRWGESETPPPPAADWAERAARAIISEFDDRGASMNEAFHPEKVDEDTRKEIIVVMAAIIRQAAKAAR
ncbi:hypothetical protein LM497_32860 [Pseudomonas aeruginosa]|uniref:hypothetical protein n=1 Tax=Pseudomonas aeruginosa TaxID=287 RepID=UPI0021482B0E|nr:hypothetical protein [Pseudomonas aeruginosa]MCQ9730735.1 hypothetical protein [Pseudomonas aeruginosa]MCS8284320.1 hypothetical protein [Pseudomonas aeruginosa]